MPSKSLKRYASHNCFILIYCCKKIITENSFKQQVFIISPSFWGSVVWEQLSWVFLARRVSWACGQAVSWGCSHLKLSWSCTGYFQTHCLGCLAGGLFLTGWLPQWATAEYSGLSLRDTTPLVVVRAKGSYASSWASLYHLIHEGSGQVLRLFPTLKFVILMAARVNLPAVDEPCQEFHVHFNLEQNKSGLLYFPKLN